MTTTHGCYFNDGQRRAYYAIVVKGDSLRHLTFYIRSLEALGLEFETANGLTIDRQFILVHIPQKVLKHFANVYDVGIEERRIGVEEVKLKIYKYFNYRTPISQIGKKPKGEFTSAERIKVIYMMLETTRYGEDPEERGISKMIRLKMVETAYPLHDGNIRHDNDDFNANDRELLSRYFANFGMWFKEVPLDMIQRYFGTEIAFYFAWLEYFNMMLIPAAVFGTLVLIINVSFSMISDIPQIDEICNQHDMHLCPMCELKKFCVYKPLNIYCSYAKASYVFDNNVTIVFAVFMSFWATLFLNLWRRKENRLKLRWNVQFEDSELDARQEYLDRVKKRKFNIISGKLEPFIPKYLNIIRLTITVSICAFMIFLVLVAVFGVIMYKITVLGAMNMSNITYFKKNSKIISMVTGSILQVIFIKLFGRMYGKLSIWLTNFENPRTQHDFDNSVLYKRYLLSFANNYAALFYIAFVKGRLYTRPHQHSFLTTFERDTCQPSTCIVALCIQLAFLLIFKKLTGNFLTLVIPKCKTLYKRIRRRKYYVQDLPQYEEEYNLQPTNRYLLLSEYSEMIIEYGFVTFFVAAFPLAPLCALLNNIIELRLDAYKLLNLYRRPIPRRVPGIGAWNGVLLGITFLSTATNAFVIAFTSDFIARELYRYNHDKHLVGFINSTLSSFGVAEYDPFAKLEPKLDVCYYRAMRHPYNHPQKYELTGEYWVDITWRLVCVFIFEHIILLCNAILSYAIPDIPQSVKEQLNIDRQLAKEAKLKLVNKGVKVGQQKGKRFSSTHIDDTLIRRRNLDSYVESGPIGGFFY